MEEKKLCVFSNTWKKAKQKKNDDEKQNAVTKSYLFASNFPFFLKRKTVCVCGFYDVI